MNCISDTIRRDHSRPSCTSFDGGPTCALRPSNSTRTRGDELIPLPKSVKRRLQPLRSLARFVLGHQEERARFELRANQRGTRRRCYICGKSFDHFYPYRGGSAEIPPFLLVLSIIGSDVDNFSCPHCRSFDRERHVAMYLDRLKLWDTIRMGAVLHIAPERHLRDLIARLRPKEYVQGDMFPESPDVQKIDVTAIGYPAEHFDFVICNHVLEHVPEDRQAMRELYRVLKRGGNAVTQVPFSTILTHSFEDPGINTDELRSKFYGQEDHVRVYGQDVFERLKEVGFAVDLQTHQAVLADIDPDLYGVNPREDLILLTKSRDRGR